MMPSGSILNRVASVLAAPNTGEPTLSHLVESADDEDPIDFTSRLRPLGQWRTQPHVVVTTPFKTDESICVIFPGNVGSRLVSIETSCPVWISFP
jgi:hypothetical protein